VTFVSSVLPILVLGGMSIANTTSVQRTTGEQVPIWGIVIGSGLVVIFAVISLAVAHSSARGEVEGRKFCEECQEYMKPSRLCALPLDTTRRAVLYLLDWDLAGLSQMRKVDENAKNRCEMDLWTCSGHYTNYLELTTHGKIGKKEYNGRRVFSAYLSPEHVGPLASGLGVTPFAE